MIVVIVVATARNPLPSPPPKKNGPQFRSIGCHSNGRESGPNKLPTVSVTLFFPAGLLLAPLFAGHLGEFCGRKGILVVNALCWGSIVVLWKGLKGQLAGLVK